MNNRKIVVIWEFILHFPNRADLPRISTLKCLGGIKVNGPNSTVFISNWTVKDDSGRYFIVQQPNYPTWIFSGNRNNFSINITRNVNKLK